MAELDLQKWGDAPFATETDKCHSILRPAVSCTTTVDVSIHALAIALVFEHMKTEEGRGLLAEIVERTLPKDTGLLPRLELKEVQGHANLVTFSFEAKGYQLSVEDPTRYEVNSPFTIDPSKLREIELAKMREDVLSRNPSPWVWGKKQLEIDWLSKNQQQAISPVYLLPPWVPQDEQEAARKPKKGKALALLTHSNQTVMHFIHLM